MIVNPFEMLEGKALAMREDGICILEKQKLTLGEWERELFDEWIWLEFWNYSYRRGASFCPVNSKKFRKNSTLYFKMEDGSLFMGGYDKTSGKFSQPRPVYCPNISVEDWVFRSWTDLDDDLEADDEIDEYIGKSLYYLAKKVFRKENLIA